MKRYYTRLVRCFNIPKSVAEKKEATMAARGKELTAILAGSHQVDKVIWVLMVVAFYEAGNDRLTIYQCS